MGQLHHFASGSSKALINDWLYKLANYWPNKHGCSFSAFKAAVQIAVIRSTFAHSACYWEQLSPAYKSNVGGEWVSKVVNKGTGLADAYALGVLEHLKR